jgi:hypothetical protein
VRFSNHHPAIPTSVVIDHDTPVLVHTALIAIMIANIHTSAYWTYMNANIIGQSRRQRCNGDCRCERYRKRVAH